MREFEDVAMLREARAPPIRMPGTSPRQFGLIIAYVLPGFIALVGLAPIMPAVARWLQPVSAAQFDLELGPPLYAILAATTAGLVLSCMRWAFLDQTHRLMGVRRPTWNDSQLNGVLSGFDYLVQNHYRYYEFCGNSLLAVLFGYLVNRVNGTSSLLSWRTDGAVALVLVVLFVASRSALVNYYARTERLIGSEAHLETHDVQRK